MRQGTADALQRELSRRLDCYLFDCHPHNTALQCSAQLASRGASTMPLLGRSPMLQARELLFPVCGWFAEGLFRHTRRSERREGPPRRVGGHNQDAARYAHRAGVVAEVTALQVPNPMEPRHARHRTKPPVPCPGLAGHCERTLKGTLLPSPDFLPATTPNLARNAINNCKGLHRPSFSPLDWFLREHGAASLEEYAASITPQKPPEPRSWLNRGSAQGTYVSGRPCSRRTMFAPCAVAAVL